MQKAGNHQNASRHPGFFDQFPFQTALPAQSLIVVRMNEF